MKNKQLPIPRKLLIFRNGNIGNTLVAEPLIRTLKEQLNCHITVVVDKIGREVLEGHPAIDSLIEYNKKTTHRGFLAYCRFVMQLRRAEFDTAILLKRFFRNEMIAYLANIPVRLGFCSPGVKNFKLTSVISYSEEQNIVQQNLAFLQYWNLQAQDARPQIFLPASAILAAAEWLSGHKLTEIKYFICHFGGKTVKNRRWPVEKYSQLLQIVTAKTGMSAVLLSAVSELDFNRQLAKLNPGVLIADSLPLKTACSLIQKAAYFIGNDSGPSHLAEAVGQNGSVFYTHQQNVLGQISKWKPAGDNYLAIYSPDGDLNNLSVDSACEQLLLHLEHLGVK